MGALTFDDLVPGAKPPEAPAKSGALTFDDLVPGAKPAAPAETPAAAPGGPSDTEKRLTADTLRALLEARNAGRGGSLTERATDWLVPGIKNVIGGATMALGTPFGEGTLGERWRAGVNAEKQFREQNRAETAGPVGYAADVAGLLGSMGRAGGAVGAPASIGAPTVAATETATRSLPRAIASGATQGAVSGAAENAQDVGSAIRGGIIGGGVGAGTGAASHILSGLIGRAAGNKLNLGAESERAGFRGPTPESYFQQAGDKFKQLDTAGIQFDQGQARRLGGMLPQVLKDANYTKTSSPELTDALRAVYTAGAKNAPPLTFTELQALRSKVADAGAANPANPNLNRIAKRVTGMIDDFVENNAPNINRTGADLATLYPEARKLWRTGLLGETVQDMEKVAANRAAVSSTGMDPEDIVRRSVAQQANKEIKQGFSPLSPVAEAARQKVIEGSPNLDRITRAAQSWPVKAALGMLGGGGGAAIGLPVGGYVATSVLGPALSTGVGAVTNRIADKATRANTDALVRAIMTGSADKPQVWDMPRDQLAALLARRGAQRAVVGPVADAAAQPRKRKK